MWQNQIVHKKLKKVIKTYWVFSFSLDRELSYKTCQFGRKLGKHLTEEEGASLHTSDSISWQMENKDRS